MSPKHNDASSRKQLRLILKLIGRAEKDKRLIFIKGGWNIDLCYGKVTREHGDIDFHYDIADYNYWRGWFRKLGFQEKQQDKYLSTYESPDGYHVDMEGFSYNSKKRVIAWKNGRTAGLDDVVEEKKYKGQKFYGMKLAVEKYLKLQHEDYGKRERDKHDIKLLNEILGE